MVNYFYDCYSILNKVYSDKAYFKQAVNSTFIEESNRALTVKTCYGVLDRDIELSYYIKYFTEKSPKLVIRTILKISMYAIKYLGKHGYAVTKNAVELTKKLGKAGASGFVNAFLRRFLSEDVIIPTDKTEALSIKYSYPLFAVKRLISDYGIIEAEKIMASINQKNTLVFYNVDGDKYLNDLGVEHENTPFSNVFFVKNFVRNADYDKGVFTYQALGSVAICDVVKPGKKLLDCCSAPGGKSVRLSNKFDEVIACDIHEHRVNLINEYALRMGANNVKTYLLDSKIYNDDFKDGFDAVLCDAPCSGMGVVNDNPDIKINREEKNVFELNKEQFSILNNVCKYVKKGGYLYYSTCSVFRLENDDVIEKFLLNNTNFSIEEIDSPVACLRTKFGLQFLPHLLGGLGFYVCALKRNS